MRKEDPVEPLPEPLPEPLRTPLVDLLEPFLFFDRSSLDRKIHSLDSSIRWILITVNRGEKLCYNVIMEKV